MIATSMYGRHKHRLPLRLPGPPYHKSKSNRCSLGWPAPLSCVPTRCRRGWVVAAALCLGRKPANHKPYDGMGLQLPSGVLGSDFQAAPWSHLEGRPPRLLVAARASLLESKLLREVVSGGDVLTPRALVPNTSGLMCIIALPRESGCCPCLLAAGERQAADAASCTRRARSLSQHCTKVGDGQLALSQYVPSRWRWLPHALPCAQTRQPQL